MSNGVRLFIKLNVYLERDAGEFVPVLFCVVFIGLASIDEILFVCKLVFIIGALEHLFK